MFLEFMKGVGSIIYVIRLYKLQPYDFIQLHVFHDTLLLISCSYGVIRLKSLFHCMGYVGRCVLLTLWQKLHTVSRPTLTSEGMRRSTLNLVE